MSIQRVRGQSQRSDLSRLAAEFGRIAASIGGRQSADAVVEIVRATQVLCATASRSSSDDLSALLTNVQTALETWRAVWPRLGARAEFRQAVAREAGLWSRRLAELAKQA